MIEIYIESRGKCLIDHCFFLMIIVEWSTGLFYTFNRRNAWLGEKNAKDTQMCNFELKLFFVILLFSNS